MGPWVYTHGPVAVPGVRADRGSDAGGDPTVPSRPAISPAFGHVP
ncbi:MAG: hypothetical protein JWM15_147, partial [Cryptosporangiaceae bacterium]|nr:hypothetical protein [Cryptosporangiaceae bacterium]